MKTTDMLGCVIVAGIVSLTSGCATIVKGNSQSLSVKTDPPGAACELARKGKTVAVVNPTPGSTQVSKGAAALNVTCKKQGYLDAAASASSSVQGWTLGNLLIGGVVGLVVDAGSGAMHQYQPEISLKLLPESFESEDSRDTFFDTWRAEVMSQSESAKAAIAGKCAKDQCDKLLQKADEKAQQAFTEVESSRKRAIVATAGR